MKFQPPLPNEKIAAIKNLGFGLVNKLILFFQNVFWDRDVDFICSCSNSTQDRGKFFLFVNMFKVVGAPILVAMIAGQSAAELEVRSGEEVVTMAIQTLQRIYGKSVTNPNRAVVTRWAGDPFARGAFSYLGVGCNGSEFDILAKPIGDQLFFAGEATSK